MSVKFKKGELVKFKKETVEKCVHDEKDLAIVSVIGQSPMEISFIDSFGYVFTEELRSLPIDPKTIERA